MKKWKDMAFEDLMYEQDILMKKTKLTKEEKEEIAYALYASVNNREYLEENGIDAEKTLLKALDYNPNLYEAMVKLADLFQGLYKKEDAITYYERAYLEYMKMSSAEQYEKLGFIEDLAGLYWKYSIYEKSRFMYKKYIDLLKSNGCEFTSNTFDDTGDDDSLYLAYIKLCEQYIQNGDFDKVEDIANELQSKHLPENSKAGALIKYLKELLIKKTC